MANSSISESAWYQIGYRLQMMNLRCILFNMDTLHIGIQTKKKQEVDYDYQTTFLRNV